MPSYTKTRRGASKKAEPSPFVGCYGSITREQPKQLDEAIERENAIRRQWCYVCSLAYVPLKNESFPPAIADTSWCADCWEDWTYRLLNMTADKRAAYFIRESYL